MGKRVCICGLGESGKDEVAGWLGKHTHLKYVGSTSWFAANRVYLYMTMMGHKYSSVEECWKDRRNHRTLWADFIDNVINKDNPIQLYEYCLSQQDILTGIRRKREIEAVIERLNPLTIWIDRQDVPHDPTQEYGPEVCDIIISNNGTLDELYAKLERFKKCLMVT